jgi:GNAT superfamily N-acetyltransferase
MIDYLPNQLSALDFRALRLSAGWTASITDEQIDAAIARSLLCVSARDGDKTVGMGRLVGDGALIWYVQDVIVLSEYQGLGVGKEIMERLIGHVKKTRLPGTRVTIGLMAALGKEGFYEKLGFHARLGTDEGPGMTLILPEDAPCEGIAP